MDEESVPKSSGVGCEAVEELDGSLADARACRDRQSGRDLTLSSVNGYESGVPKVKKEIPVN